MRRTGIFGLGSMVRGGRCEWAFFRASRSRWPPIGLALFPPTQTLHPPSGPGLHSAHTSLQASTDGRYYCTQTLAREKHTRPILPGHTPSPTCSTPPPHIPWLLSNHPLLYQCTAEPTKPQPHPLDADIQRLRVSMKALRHQILNCCVHAGHPHAQPRTDVIYGYHSCSDRGSRTTLELTASPVATAPASFIASANI